MSAIPANRNGGAPAGVVPPDGNGGMPADAAPAYGNGGPPAGATNGNGGAPVGELEVLKVREEVLQAMYWMGAEGIAKEPTARNLASFLALPADQVATYLERFAAEGHLESTGPGFRLTDSGAELGKRSFADEFADMTAGAHGECGADCQFCNANPDAAASCLEGSMGGSVPQH